MTHYITLKGGARLEIDTDRDEFLRFTEAWEARWKQMTGEGVVAPLTFTFSTGGFVLLEAVIGAAPDPSPKNVGYRTVSELPSR